MTVIAHKVHVIAQGKLVPGWKSYNVSCDILQPADSFSLSVQFSREAYELLALDVEVSIFIDGARILTGYVGTREKVPSNEGTMLRITGRDKTGRLVDESAALFSYGGLHIKELAEKICDIGGNNALFEKVTLTNGTRDRPLFGSSRAQRTKFVREPVLDDTVGLFRPLAGLVGAEIDTVGKQVKRPPKTTPGIFKGRAGKKRVQPGQKRWAVLEEFLKEARLLAWSTADGKELFIGLPAYDQTPEYYFHEPAGTSEDKSANCSITVTENVEEMFALYVAIGAAKGSGSNYGPNVTKNLGAAKDNPESSDGTGIHFRRPKTLLITDDSIRNQRDAEERAEREQLQRESGRLEIVVQVAGHSQMYTKDEPIVYAVDKMAKVVDGDTGIKDDFYITAVDYFGGDGGTRTELRLVPRGTLLSL